MAAIPYQFVGAPALIVHPGKARGNIRKMKQKADRTGVTLRPHFKTHQSRRVGEWFREEGISRITVSSLEMAEYFAKAGWNDICIAIPVNPRQTAQIAELAGHCTLSVVVENSYSLQVLGEKIKAPVKVWIEVDTGDGRSGVNFDQAGLLRQLASKIRQHPGMEFGGLLTHAGNSYACRGAEEILATHSCSLTRLKIAKTSLEAKGFTIESCSIGDTPGCSMAKDFGIATEIRPGNFVYYDCMQMEIGACVWEDIALALAAPVISVRPDKGQLILHGGAVHLSKDFLSDAQGAFFGKIAQPAPGGWERPYGTLRLSKLSQEHGTVTGDKDLIASFKPGDLLMVLPVHSCLSADLMQKAYLPDGSLVEGRSKG